MNRTMKCGVIPRVSSVFVMAAALYGGYHAYQDWVTPYKVEKESGQHYLVDKEQDRRKIITKDFELGSLDDRVGGIFGESKERLLEAIDQAKKSYLDSQQKP